MIKNCAAAGIPSIKYNMSILGVVRTGPHAGTRRRHLQHLEIKEAKPNTPLTRAGE